MKRAGALFERVCAFESLVLAARRAQAGKRYRIPVLEFNARLEDNLQVLRRELLDGSYRPGRHRHFRIYEPKTRWISAAPYRDRVVHHALCKVVEPVLDRRLIFDCWANRVGKGSHRAILRCQRFAGRFRHALKMDVRKYFPSIDHALLKAQLREVLKDRRVLELFDRIIDQGENPEPAVAYFAGDDLFTPHVRVRGLPIGNLTSQLLATSTWPTSTTGSSAGSVRAAICVSSMTSCSSTTRRRAWRTGARRCGPVWRRCACESTTASA